MNAAKYLTSAKNYGIIDASKNLRGKK